MMRSIVILLSMLPFVGFAADMRNGTWRVDQIAVELYPCQEAACGKIVWVHNPAQRNFCDRMIIWGLTSDGASEWGGGSFLNPENGKTYNLKATVDSNTQITARIYQGIPLLGRTEILTRIRSHSLAGWCG